MVQSALGLLNCYIFFYLCLLKNCVVSSLLYKKMTNIQIIPHPSV